MWWWHSLYRYRIRQNSSILKRFWRENRVLLLILAGALILRLFVLFTEGNRMFLGTDDDNYRESAEILLRKGVLTYSGWREPTVFIMPGYPLILAGVFSLVGSTSWLAARFFQILVSLAALWFAVKLGTRLGGRSVGLLSGMLVAVYPPNLTAPCFLMTEVVFTCLLLVSLVSFAKAEETRRAGWFVLTGFLLGLSVYFRPISALLPVVFGVYLVLRGYPWEKMLVDVSIMGVVLVLCLSPWIIRNYLIYKQFIPLTVSGGNPFLRGTYLNDKIDEKLPWVEGDRISSDRAQMEYGKKRFVEGFKTNFRGYLRWYTIEKFSDFWGGPYYYRQLTYLPAKWVNMFHRFLLWTGLAGLIAGLWRRKPLPLLFLLISGYFTFIHMVYLTGPRYSFPVMQLAVIMAAYLIIEGVRAVSGKRL